RLPERLVTQHIWRGRYEDINAFERYLGRNGTLFLKFFLYVSKAEQRKRLMERLDQPAKNWKFEPRDLDERDKWDDHMRAFEQALSRTSARHAPWFIVPADHKWFARLVIAEAIVQGLESLGLTYPKLSKEQLVALAQARKRLASEP